MRNFKPFLILAIVAVLVAWVVVRADGGIAPLAFKDLRPNSYVKVYLPNANERQPTIKIVTVSRRDR